MDPSTMALVGAGIGAMMDEEQPLRGATLGGIGGYAGGTMMGPSMQGANVANLNAMGAGAGSASTGAMSLAPQAGMSSLNTMGAASGAGGMSLGQTSPSVLSTMGGGTTAMSPNLQNSANYLNSIGGGTTAMSPNIPQTSALQKGLGMVSKLPTISEDGMTMVQSGQALAGMGGQEQPQQAPRAIQAPQLNPSAGESFQRPEEEMFGYLYNQPSILPAYRR